MIFKFFQVRHVSLPLRGRSGLLPAHECICVSRIKNSPPWWSANDQISAFETLESKILEKAGHSGLGDWIEFDEESQRFRVKAEREENLFYHECYEEFRNESFWDELAVRLADRDLARAIGFKEWEKLSEEDRRARTSAWEKRYWEEFSKRGVEHVVLVTPPNEG
jgi:hypothetical protein